MTDGRLEVGEGPLADADLAIEAGPGIRALMAGELSPAAAIKNGVVRITGDAELLSRFAQIFRIEPLPNVRPVSA